MSEVPCSVCGNTDLNLVDGYYYCVECGTQDVNVRETVIEYTALADGTLGIGGVKKFTTVVKDGIQMSSEWHKWHAYNFILSGMADELIALGAKKTVKMKVLWIWTRYIKKYQNKENLTNVSLSIIENEENAKKDDKSDDSSEESDSEIKKKKKKREDAAKNIQIVSKSLLFSMLYVALNLDESDIQLSHLLRFVREGRLTYLNCTKFVPKEIDVKTIPQWRSFSLCQKICSTQLALSLSMSLFKKLDLGLPKVPNLRDLIDNYANELCLPDEMKDIVFSLMQTVKCDYLNIDKEDRKDLFRVVDYECNAISFIVIAMKMAFGLDDKYEYEISDYAEMINNDELKTKSYKLGSISESTNRLFSFREWLNFIQFRKSLLSKQYLPMAQKFNLDVDDYVFMEQLEPRTKRPAKLGDEVTVDILNKIPLNEDGRYIPKSEFLPTLTPMSTYTEVILQYTQDPDLRLLLSEDFTKYSINFTYDTKIMNKDSEILCQGIKELGKKINAVIENSTVRHGDNNKIINMVYVRDCDNKNWLKTNPPNAKHVKIKRKSCSDKDSDPGYDSNTENIGEDDKLTLPLETETEHKKMELIEEENVDKNIFDDLFNDINDDEKGIPESDFKDSTLVDFEINDDPSNNDDDKTILQETILNMSDDTSTIVRQEFNPETFDRKETIKELVLAACQKYKIPLPDEYRVKIPRKRKNVVINIDGQSEAKKPKRNYTKKGEAKAAIDEIINAYYENMHDEILKRISNHVINLIELSENPEPCPNNNNEDNNIESESVRSPDNTNQELQPDTDSTNGNDLTEIDKTQASSKEVESDDESVDLIPKGDPKFDEKKYDVRQLFLKFQNEFNIEDILDTDDPEIEKLFIEKSDCNDCDNQDKESNDVVRKHSESLSEDDIPLNEIQSKKMEREKRKKENLERLLGEKRKKQHKYWLRHYPPTVLRKTSCKNVFDLELKERFPFSFTLIILECAEMLQTSAFLIYKNVQILEEALFKSL